MTIAAVPPRVQYVASGIPGTIYAVPFRVFDAIDIKVYLGTALQATGYQVTLIDEGVSGAAVTFLTPPAAGTLITFLRQIAIVRETDFAQAGEFRAATVNALFDRLVAIDQQLADELARTMRLSPTATGGAPTLPSAIYGKAIIWDAIGNFVNSVMGPDEAAAVATAATATASSLSAEVSALAALVSDIVSAAQPYGEIPRTGTVTLVAGTQTYSILGGGDDPISSVNQMRFSHGLEPVDDVSLGGDGKSITFQATIVAGVPAAGELEAGLVVRWFAGGNLRTIDIPAGTVSAPKLADGAVDLVSAKVANLTARRFLTSDASGRPLLRAFPGVGEALGGDGNGDPQNVTLPAAASDGDVTAGTGTGYVKSSQLPLRESGKTVTGVIDGANGNRLSGPTAWTTSNPSTGIYGVVIPVGTFASADVYHVSVTPLTASPGRYATVTAKTATGFTVRVHTGDINNEQAIRLSWTVTASSPAS